LLPRSKARFTSSHLLFLRSGQARFRHWSRGCTATKKGPAELERVVLHKGNTLAESCEDAGDRGFVQEKMNKVKNERGTSVAGVGKLKV